MPRKSILWLPHVGHEWILKIETFNTFVLVINCKGLQYNSNFYYNRPYVSPTINVYLCKSYLSTVTTTVRYTEAV